MQAIELVADRGLALFLRHGRELDLAHDHVAARQADSRRSVGHAEVAQEGSKLAAPLRSRTFAEALNRGRTEYGDAARARLDRDDAQVFAANLDAETRTEAGQSCGEGGHG